MLFPKRALLPFTHRTIGFFQPCLSIHETMTIGTLSQCIESRTFFAYLNTLGLYFLKCPVLFLEQIPRLYGTHTTTYTQDRWRSANEWNDEYHHCACCNRNPERMDIRDIFVGESLALLYYTPPISHKFKKFLYWACDRFVIILLFLIWWKV